jgi:hypothetical protein
VVAGAIIAAAASMAGAADSRTAALAHSREVTRAFEAMVFSFFITGFLQQNSERTQPLRVGNFQSSMFLGKIFYGVSIL